MRIDDQIKNQYFEWIYSLMCHDRFSPNISYRKLFMTLHSTEFVYSIPMDYNREQDGLSLRWRFALDHSDIPDADLYLDDPCSVLEMMVALALRCEETIMDDPLYGDRSQQWFWDMIRNLGLFSMYDRNYDKHYVVQCIDRFLTRTYSPDGRGGLFTIRNCKEDLRKVEIWYQLNWYLNTLV